MSEPEKPLHVRVAEALGWSDLAQCSDHLGIDASGWDGWSPQHIPIIGRRETYRSKVPRWDLEWDETGPLIEQFQISLEFIPPRADLDARWPYGFWSAQIAGVVCPAATPLKSVCECLILYHDIRSTIGGAA